MNIDVVIGLNNLVINDECLICKAQMDGKLLCKHLLGNGKKKMQFRNGKTHIVTFKHSDDLTLMQFGNWKVLDFDTESRKYKCECQCELHTIKLVVGTSLRSGASTSCRKCRQAAFKIGTRVGNWEVVGDIVDNRWVPCRCHCGYCDSNISMVDMYQLLYGKTHGCTKSTNKNLIEDITGKTFGRWKAIEYKGHSKWLCECSCEEKTRQLVALAALKSGESKSCGCLKAEKMRNDQLIDLTGKKFGKLKVESYFGKGIWYCTCECGGHALKLSHSLRRSNTITCGCEDPKPLEKEYIISKIKEFQLKNNRLPFRDEIGPIIDRAATSVGRYIDRYNLYDYVQHIFGSKYEYELSNMYKHMKINKYIMDSSGTKVQLDLWDTDKNIAIEFNGSYWHGDYLKDKNYHQNKTLVAAENKIRLFHIFEYEWVDENKRNKIIEVLNRTLGITSQNKIYARNTVVKLINSSECCEFLDKYHLQNGIKASINIGCYYNNELIGVMALGSPRFSNDYEYEILRLCWKNSVKVVGGTKKIFSFFVKNYKPISIVTYTDLSKFVGGVYTDLGFKTSRKHITSPNYVWVNAQNEVVTRYSSQKHKLIKLGLGTSEQTEDEIMRGLRFWKVYDCGNLKFEWFAQQNMNDTAKA